MRIVHFIQQTLAGGGNILKINPSSSFIISLYKTHQVSNEYQSKAYLLYC